MIFMEWKKSPEDLVDFIMGKMKSKNCDYKKMFGYPAFFVNGNMFTGLFADKLFLRLSDSDGEKIKKEYPGAGTFEVMPGRVMKDYVTLPKEVYCDEKTFDQWIDKSMKYAAALPPKKSKKILAKK